MPRRRTASTEATHIAELRFNVRYQRAPYNPKPGTKCQDCKTVLNRYNQGSRCYPCEHRVSEAKHQRRLERERRRNQS